MVHGSASQVEAAFGIIEPQVDFVTRVVGLVEGGQFTKKDGKDTYTYIIRQAASTDPHKTSQNPRELPKTPRNL